MTKPIRPAPSAGPFHRARRLVLLVALALVGCGGPTSVAPIVAPPTSPVGAPSTSPSSAPAAAPSASPTPALLILAQAAAAYKAIATTYNEALEVAYNDYGRQETLEAQKKYWAVLAAAADVFLDALKTIAFPSDIQDPADRLITSSIVFQRAALSASKSKTLAELDENATEAGAKDEDAVDDAAILRDALGLPPNS